MHEPVVIATWPFGAIAARAALPLLDAGRPALDAAVAGAQAVEDDPSVHTVGLGGMPDALGVVTLDACVMDGRTLACGAVAAVENVRHVTALARRVMEHTPHLLLAGAGARQFAVAQGFPLEALLTAAGLAEWQRRRPGEGHDTVTVLTLDRGGTLGGACSTSGLAHKLHGRVGDSPIPGAGLYVDDTAGAGGGTGVGEEILRVGGSLLIVEALRAGRTARQACELAVRRVAAAAARRGVAVARVAFLALSPTGECGAACTPGTAFRYAVGRAGQVTLHDAVEVGDGA